LFLQRKFDAHGKNSYRLLNEDGKMVSNKKKDLEEMLDRLNVQVDNPVCIMDQENSKEFIKGNEKEKYRFFAKATDLERVVTKIQSSKNELDRMVKQSHDAKSRLKGFALDAQKAEEELRELQQVLKIDENISKLRCLMFWHDAEVKQAKLEEHEGNHELALQKEVEREAALAKAQADLESKQTPEEGLAEIERLKGENDKAQENVDRINHDIGALKKPLGAVDKEIGMIKRRAAELAHNQKGLKKQISDAHAEATSTASGEEERRVAGKLEEAKAQAEASDQEARDLREQLQPLDGEAAQAKQELKQAEAAARSQEGECRSLKSEVQTLRSAQDTPAAQFGQKTPQILSMIAKESRFEHKPVGPLGSFVKLRDGVPGGAQKWAKAVRN
jgi:chromosome segregation ATPase